MKILLLNAGSSSLKASLVEAGDGNVLASGLADWAGSATRFRYTGPDGEEQSAEVGWTGHAEAVRHFIRNLTEAKPPGLADLSALAAVGHRVVHGGPFTSTVRITPEVRSQLAALADLAPLHNPPSLAALAAAEEALPKVPHVAVFDTSFHSTLPAQAFTYPVPERWTREWGIRRFGFHGLSHAYCARRAAELLGKPPADLRLVICHLGHGCSAAAVEAGRCVDTTMGFTPLEGLMMGSRSGTLDPSIVLHVQEKHGLTTDAVDTALNRESGLLGVSGVSADMREVLAAADAGNEPARLALAIYAHRVRQAIGALTVTMGGVDALVFTAGVGEHAAAVREAICTGLECLGLALDHKTNGTLQPDADVAREDSFGRILIIATREDVTMLREVVGVLSEGGGQSGVVRS
jgi:acetate kinase